MRTWTAAQIAAFGLDGPEICFFVSVDWPSGKLYYANRDFSPDFGGGIHSTPVLAKPPDCAREMNLDLSGVPLAGATSLELLSDSGDPDNIETRLESEPTVVGVEVQVFAVFYALSAKDSVVAADWEDNPLGVYEITEVVSVEYDRVLFSLADAMESAGKPLVCRTISRELTGDAVQLLDDVWGRAIPIYLGAYPDAPAIPWGVGKSTRLDGGIDFDTLSFFVADIAEIEAGDTIAVDAEHMLVNSVVEGTDTTAPKIVLAPDGRGQNETEAIEHSDGAAVRKVLAETPFLHADRSLSKLGGVANPLPSPWEFRGKIAEKSVAVVAEERTLSGETSTFLLLPDGLPTVQEDGSVERVSLDGPSGGWDESGTSTSSSYLRTGDPADWQTVENTAIGAIGPDEEDSHIEFTLLDPPAGKLLAAVVYDVIQAGRQALLKNLTLRCKFQIVPGENLPALATDYPRDPWELVVRRDGVEIARGELGFPPLDVFRGLLDKTDFIPGLEDSRYLFTEPGLGSQSTAIMVFHHASTGTITYQHSDGVRTWQPWKNYADLTPGTDTFIPDKSVGFFQETTSQDPPTASIETPWLELAPLFGPSTRTLTKFRIELDCIGDNWVTNTGTSTGDCKAQITLAGGIGLIEGFVRLADEERRTIVLEHESDLVVDEEGTCTTNLGGDIVVNLSFSTGSGSIDEGKTIVTSRVPGLFLPNTKVIEIISDTSIKIYPPPQGTHVTASILVSNPDKFIGIPINDIGVLRIFGDSFAGRLVSFPETETLGRANFELAAIRFIYWSKDESKLVGAGTPLAPLKTSIADALLMASSPSYEKALRLTDHVRDGDTYETPYHFFDEPIEVSVESAVPAVASTRVLLTDIFFDLRERPWVERQLTDADLSQYPLLVDTEGEFSDNLRLGSGTRLPEAPEDAIYWCLKTIWELSDAQILSADVEGGLLRACEDRQWWKFARRIDDPNLQRKAFLSQLCRDAAIRPINDGGVFRFVPIGDFGAASVASIGMTEIKGRPTKEFSPESMTVNQWGVYYRRKPYGDRNFLGRHEANDTGSQSTAMGVRRDTVDLEHVRDTPTAVAWGGEALRESAHSRLMVGRFTVPWSQGRVNVGDVVDLTHTYANLAGLTGVVAGIRQQDLDEIAFSVWSAGYKARVWTAPGDETTYIEVLPVLGIMVFVFEGVVVANLTRDSVWLLKGGLDPIITAASTQTDMIEKSAGGFEFGIDFGGPSRETRMTLTPSGDLTLWGDSVRSGAFFANPLYPVLSSHTLYIEEKFAGGAPAVLSFSVDLENQQAKLAGDVDVSGRISGLISRKFDPGTI